MEVLDHPLWSRPWRWPWCSSHCGFFLRFALKCPPYSVAWVVKEIMSILCFSYLFLTNGVLYLFSNDCNTIKNVRLYTKYYFLYFFSFMYSHASLTKIFLSITWFVWKIQVCIPTTKYYTHIFFSFLITRNISHMML